MTTWADLPNGTTDIRKAFAAELHRLDELDQADQRAAAAADAAELDERDRLDDRCPARSRITETPCALPAGHAGQHAMHDDGNDREPGTPGHPPHCSCGECEARTHDNGDYRA